MSYNHEEATRKTASDITSALNSMAMDKKAVGEALIHEHRTLQQSFAGVAVEYFKALLESGRYDGRNEATYKFAKSIEKQLDEAYFPFI